MLTTFADQNQLFLSIYSSISAFFRDLPPVSPSSCSVRLSGTGVASGFLVFPLLVAPLLCRPLPLAELVVFPPLPALFAEELFAVLSGFGNWYRDFRGGGVGEGDHSTEEEGALEGGGGKELFEGVGV